MYLSFVNSSVQNPVLALEQLFHFISNKEYSFVVFFIATDLPLFADLCISTLFSVSKQLKKTVFVLSFESSEHNVSQNVFFGF